MIAAVQTILDGLVGSQAVLQQAAGMGRVFELFVLTGIASRLRSHGLDVWLQRSDGSRITPTDATRRFIQRGGVPSGVPPANAGTSNATVVAFRSIGGAIWEIWNGVQFEGRSGATHEIDIAIVPGEVGNELRLGGVTRMPLGRPRVAIECKDVGTPAAVDEMRAFVARLYDLTLLRAHQRYLSQPPPLQAIYPGNLAGDPFHRSRMTHWQENRHTKNIIARRTGFSAGSIALTTYYSVEPHAQITVGSPAATALFDAVAGWMLDRCP